MDAQYQSLYRKYRPQTPNEVIGQDHVVRALVGAVRENKLAHAFLFTGPRGTGKTSTARILAKMVNCEKGPTAEPCDVCEQCLRIRDGSHLDVVEIDAASHGGVEDARELRERAPTAPAQGREKVYIIDEAQRLSREAFDALLKVFEEPPPGVRFVLATTEPHKMPATIVGRCQRFDFRRLSGDALSAHLVRVAADEGVALDEASAEAIARQAEGSARDALSLLDQAVVLGGATVDEKVLEALLGAPRGEVHYALGDAVAVGDTLGVFGVVHRLVQEGHDVRHFTSEALQHFRNLLLVQAAPGQPNLVDVTEDEYERLRGQAAKFRPAELTRVISLLLAAQMDMRWTTSPRLTLELALVRASMPEADPAPEGLIGRIERLERLAGLDVPGARSSPATGAVRSGGSSPLPQLEGAAADAHVEPRDKLLRGSPPPTRAPAAASTPPRSSAPARTDPPPTRAPAAAPPAHGSSAPAPANPPPIRVPAAAGEAVDVEMLRRSWNSGVIELLRERKKMALAAILDSVTPSSYEDGVLELAFPPRWTSNAKRVEAQQADILPILDEVFGIKPALRCVVREVTVSEADDVEDEEPISHEAAIERLRAQLDATVSAEPDARA